MAGRNSLELLASNEIGNFGVFFKVCLRRQDAEFRFDSTGDASLGRTPQFFCERTLPCDDVQLRQTYADERDCCHVKIATGRRGGTSNVSSA